MFEFLAIFIMLAATSGVSPSAPKPGAISSLDPTPPVGADGVIGADDRKLLSEFTLDGVADQAAMRASLAATQRLSCGASASLVYRNDVIVFSAHQLIDKKGKLDPDLDHCFFAVGRRIDGALVVERYPLLLATLDNGPPAVASGIDEVWNHGNQDDWAIVRLARPVTGIEPYRLPEHDSDGEPGASVTTVSDTTDNWSGASQVGDMLAQSCHVIDAEPRLKVRYPAVMHLDCDVGRGASGSAILQDVASGRPTYVGTTIAYTGNHCARTGLTTCFSIGRRMDAELAARIKGTTATRSTTEDQAFADAQDARIAAARDARAARAEAILTAAFPAQDDAVGRQVAALHVRISALVAQGRAAETDALFLDAFRALHDPDQRRPEWMGLLIANGESMALQQRRADAFQCFHSALEIAPDEVKPYIKLRMAQTTADQEERRQDFREAYLAGGDALFRAAKAEADLAAIKATGLPTTER